MISVKTNEDPAPGDTILVWDGERPRFIEWTESNKREDFPTVYGPVIDDSL